jgi:hypothetical protein
MEMRVVTPEQFESVAMMLDSMRKMPQNCPIFRRQLPVGQKASGRRCPRGGLVLSDAARAGGHVIAERRAQISKKQRDTFAELQKFLEYKWPTRYRPLEDAYPVC